MSGERFLPSEAAIDEDAMHASLDLIRRSGAGEVEFGFANEDAQTVEQGDWYAHAQYRGARLFTEHHRGPIEALEALARRLLTGATCRRCGKPIRLSSAGKSKGTCRWRRMGDTWQPGCDKPIDPSIKAPLAPEGA